MHRLTKQIVGITAMVLLVACGGGGSGGGDENGTTPGDDNGSAPSQASSLLKKTDQTVSYDGDGQRVNRGSIKDDGYYQKGTAPSYTRANKTVADNVTGLIWQDDEAVGSVAMAWNDAVSYCDNLSLGGSTDWRLPTLNELGGIVDYSHDHPSLDPQYFNGATYPNTIDGYYFWSATKTRDGAPWSIDFDFSHMHTIEGIDGEAYVRCVRGGGS